MTYTPKAIRPYPLDVGTRAQDQQPASLAEVLTAQMTQIRYAVAGSIHAALVTYLNQHGLGSVSWLQYTPYFNDGEACEFAVNIDYPHISEQVAPLEVLQAPEVSCLCIPPVGPVSLAARCAQRQHAVMVDDCDSLISIANWFDYDQEYSEPFKTRQRDLRKLMGDAPDLIMKLIGEHAAVYVDRSGLYVQAYEDHD